MSKYFLIIFLVIFAVLLTSCTPSEVGVTDVITGKHAVETKLQAESDIAVIKAKQLFRQKLIEG